MVDTDHNVGQNVTDPFRLPERVRKISFGPDLFPVKYHQIRKQSVMYISAVFQAQEIRRQRS